MAGRSCGWSWPTWAKVDDVFEVQSLDKIKPRVRTAPNTPSWPIPIMGQHLQVSLNNLLLAASALWISLAVPARGAETWVVRTDIGGHPAFSTVTIDRERGRSADDLNGDRLADRRPGGRIVFGTTDTDGRVLHYDGRINGARIDGVVHERDTNHPATHVSHPFSAWVIPTRPDGGGRSIALHPTDYSIAGDVSRTPVLTIWSGDIVQTTEIDPGGVDEHGGAGALLGKSQSKPLLAADAKRGYAESLDATVSHALGVTLVPQAGSFGLSIQVMFDLVASQGSPTDTPCPTVPVPVPVKSILNGFGAGPESEMPVLSTGGDGQSGSHINSKEVLAGNTVYLPAQRRGALLYFGDADVLPDESDMKQYAFETLVDGTVKFDANKGCEVQKSHVETRAK